MLLLWAGCAAAQVRPVPVTDPDIPLQFQYFVIRPPASGNWFILLRSPDGVLFGRPPEKPAHTQMAWAVTKQLEAPVTDIAVFLAAARSELRRRLPEGRHDILDVRVDPYEPNPDHCIRYTIRATDNGVSGMSGAPQNFLIAGVDCLEPRQRMHVIELNYSERGGPPEWDATVQMQIEAFFSGFRLAGVSSKP